MFLCVSTTARAAYSGPGRLRDLRAEPAVLYIGDSRRTPVRCKRGSPCRLVGAVPGLHESVCDGRFRRCEMRCRNVGSGGPGNQSDVSWPLLWARASGRGSGPWLGPGCCQLPATLQAATRSLHHLQAVRRNHSVNLRVPLERPSLGRSAILMASSEHGAPAASGLRAISSATCVPGTFPGSGTLEPSRRLQPARWKSCMLRQVAYGI